MNWHMKEQECPITNIFFQLARKYTGRRTDGPVVYYILKFLQRAAVDKTAGRYRPELAGRQVPVLQNRRRAAEKFLQRAAVEKTAGR